MLQFGRAAHLAGAGVVVLAGSLAAFAPQEGVRLAESLTTCWRTRAERLVNVAWHIEDSGLRPDPSVHFFWTGYSLGRWEGDTLVVETTNFRPDFSWLGVLHSEKFKLAERFTRIDADYLLYELTDDNPEMYTRPYTLHYYLKRESHPVFEYSCHETNYNIVGELGEKRRLERTAAQKKTAPRTRTTPSAPGPPGR